MRSGRDARLARLAYENPRFRRFSSREFSLSPIRVSCEFQENGNDSFAV